MIHERTTSDSRTETTLTRRGVLAALGAFGSGLGTVSGTSATATDPGQSSDGASPFDDVDGLEAFVDDRVSRRIGDVTPGAGVAIVEGDTPVLTKGYGSANADTESPVRADETAFRVGSVGKLVTWTAVMQSVERGVLDLDENVNTYLRDSDVTVSDAYAKPVTLRHLGTHTPGFESSLDPDIVTHPDALTPLETLLADQQPSRVRPPGTLVGYSNYGAALAGHVVAEAHGTTFEDYVQSEIFEPLGMTDSTFAQSVRDDHPGELAAGHSRDGAAEFTTADEVFINMRPAGSLSATAADMATFMSAHLGNGATSSGRILAAGTTETMHETHHVRHPAVTNWRFGFHEYGDPDADLVGHSGATINFTSQLVLALDRDVGIFVSYNTNGSEKPAAVVDEIIAEFDLQPAPTQPTPTPRAGGRERTETVAGEYSATYLPDNGPLHVVDLMEHVSVEADGDGRLRTERLSGDARRWIETEPYVYREVGGRDVLAFEVSDGEVTAMHASNEPTGVYQPVPFRDRQLVTSGFVAGPAAGFGLSLAGKGTLAAWRRWAHRNDGNESTSEESG